MISLFVVTLSFIIIFGGLFLIVRMNKEGDVFKTYKDHRSPPKHKRSGR